jgi:hypothetical protein
MRIGDRVDHRHGRPQLRLGRRVAVPIERHRLDAWPLGHGMGTAFRVRYEVVVDGLAFGIGLSDPTVVLL